jgi:hypothetical protein
MSVSTPWLNSTPASVARKNMTSVISDTGANMSAMDKTKFKIVFCTATGSGFTINHLYMTSADGTSWIDLSVTQDHYHSSVDDGGHYIRILMGNPEVLDLYLSQPIHFQDTEWNTTFTGTGSAEFDGGGCSSKPYIRLRPNGTSGSGSTISYTNAQNLKFGAPSILSFTGNFETATSLAFHGGVNADDVTAADSNNNKYQAEVCTATNQNWWLRTGNGSSNSASDLGVAIGTNDTGIKMVHDPDAGTPEVVMEVDGTNTFTKTTTIPISGTNSTGNILKFSQKNNTAADRPYRYKGCRVSFITSDSWGYG